MPKGRVSVEFARANTRNGLTYPNSRFIMRTGLGCEPGFDGKMALDKLRRQQLIDRMARRIADLGLTAPAILFLEMHKPLAFLVAQLLLVAQPFLSIGLNNADLSDFAAIIEDRGGVEELIERLESIKSDQPAAPQLRQRT